MNELGMLDSVRSTSYYDLHGIHFIDSILFQSQIFISMLLIYINYLFLSSIIELPL